MTDAQPQRPGLQALLAAKRGLTKVLEVIVIGAMALLVVDVLWGVFSRHALGHQTRWTEEAARVLLIWVGLLGGAVAFGTRSHLGLDVVVSSFDTGTQKLAAVIAHTLVAVFACAVMIVGGWQLTQQTFALGQLLPALGIPKGYVYLAVPLSGVFTLMYALEAIVEVFAAGVGAGEKVQLD